MYPSWSKRTASDPTGVKRMELWVSNIKTADAVSPVEQGQATLDRFVPVDAARAGLIPWRLKPLIRRDKSARRPLSPLTAVGGAPTDADTPTPSLTPETPTATVPTNPSLTTKTDLNVRSGPGIQYDLLGLLPAGVTVEIIGREETRQWWQIRFSPAADGIGWVAADPEFSTTANVDNVPVAQFPPTPTGTPTPTLRYPATNTPTVTTVPPTPIPTGTPTLTPTATSQPTTIDFNVSPTRIEGGECVNVTWSATGVREIYFEDQGAGGSANIIRIAPKSPKPIISELFAQMALSIEKILKSKWSIRLSQQAALRSTQ